MSSELERECHLLREENDKLISLMTAYESLVDLMEPICLQSTVYESIRLQIAELKARIRELKRDMDDSASTSDDKRENNDTCDADLTDNNQATDEIKMMDESETGEVIVAKKRRGRPKGATRLMPARLAKRRGRRRRILAETTLRIGIGSGDDESADNNGQNSGKGKKSKQCSWPGCEMLFRDRQDLVNHMWRHTGKSRLSFVIC